MASMADNYAFSNLQVVKNTNQLNDVIYKRVCTRVYRQIGYSLERR